MEVISRNNFEYGENLTAEFTTIIREVVYNIITTYLENQGNVEFEGLFTSINVNIINLTETFITFSSTFPLEYESAIPDELTFENEVKSVLITMNVFTEKQVFEGDKAWYLFHRDTLKVLGFRKNHVEVSIISTMNKTTYSNLESARVDISGRLEKMCRASYRDYKRACEGLWDIGYRQDVTTGEALDLFERLSSCASKRSMNLKDCPILEETSRTGHIGAVQKIKKLRNYYGNLIIQRIQDEIRT